MRAGICAQQMFPGNGLMPVSQSTKQNNKNHGGSKKAERTSTTTTLQEISKKKSEFYKSRVISGIYQK